MISLRKSLDGNDFEFGELILFILDFDANLNGFDLYKFFGDVFLLFFVCLLGELEWYSSSKKLVKV